jgi:hypothetical protein
MIKQVRSFASSRWSRCAVTFMFQPRAGIFSGIEKPPQWVFFNKFGVVSTMPHDPQSRINFHTVPLLWPSAFWSQRGSARGEFFIWGGYDWEKKACHDPGLISFVTATENPEFHLQDEMDLTPPSQASFTPPREHPPANQNRLQAPRAKYSRKMVQTLELISKLGETQSYASPTLVNAPPPIFHKSSAISPALLDTEDIAAQVRSPPAVPRPCTHTSADFFYPRINLLHEG